MPGQSGNPQREFANEWETVLSSEKEELSESFK